VLVDGAVTSKCRGTTPNLVGRVNSSTLLIRNRREPLLGVKPLMYQLLVAL
jgi:hypothetical protein